MGHIAFRLGIATLAILTACGPNNGSLQTSGRSRNTLISDEFHNAGTPGFAFLPPLVSSAPSGTLIRGLSPVVTVEVLTDGPNAVIATFTKDNGVRQTGKAADAYYVANWDTQTVNLDASLTYRIRVTVQGLELGFADVDVVSNRKELRNVASGEFVPLLDGRTLPIKFRIGAEALRCVGVTCAPLDSCHVGACDRFSGSCSYSEKPDGSPCDDGKSCSVSDTCQSGVCRGTDEPDGTTCGTGQVCSAGTCITVCSSGQPCDLSDDPCKTGMTTCASAWSAPTCNVVEAKPDGTTCGSGKVCFAGTCVVPPAIWSVRLDDATAVTLGTVTLTAHVTVGSEAASQEVEWAVEAGSPASVNPARGASTTFLAPAQPGKYRVTAVSVADSTKKDFAYVVVQRPPDSWRKRTDNPLPANGRLVVLNGKIYAVGGYRAGGGGTVPWLEIYDPVADTWTAGPSMSIGRQSATVAFNGKIYVFGDFWNNVTSIEVYDPLSNAWTLEGAAMREGVAAVAAAGKIFAIGGRDVYGRCARTIEEYDPSSRLWTARAPTPFECPGWVFAYNGRIFASGLSDNGFWLGNYEYDPASDQWRQNDILTSLIEAPVALVPSDAFLYSALYPVVAQTSTFQVDLLTGAHQARSAVPVDVPDAIDQSAIAANGLVYVMGGRWGSGALGIVEEYTPGMLSPIMVSTGVGPCGVLFDGTNLWVPNDKSANLTKIRPRDGAVLGTYNVGTSPCGQMAFDGTYLWVTNTLDNSVSRVRAGDGSATAYSSGALPHGSMFDGANVWIANYGDSTVTKLRASDGASLGTFSVGTNPTGIAFDGVDVWVATSTEITKLSSAGVRIGSFKPVNDPYGIVFDGASIWFANHGGNTVTKFRPSDGSLLGTFTVGVAPLGIASTGTSVWVTNSGDNTVTELRATDGATICTLKTGAKPYGVAVVDGHPWVADYDSNDVRRLH